MRLNGLPQALLDILTCWLIGRVLTFAVNMPLTNVTPVTPEETSVFLHFISLREEPRRPTRQARRVFYLNPHFRQECQANADLLSYSLSKVCARVPCDDLLYAKNQFRDSVEKRGGLSSAWSPNGLLKQHTNTSFLMK